MPRTGQPSARDVEATVRAVAVLDALADGGELGTTDLSRRTGISASTVSRQLGTLARLGLVEHVPATGRYRLGVRVLRLANAVLGRLNLRDVARPHLESLVHDVGEAGTLSIPGEGDAITVDFVPSDRYLQGVTRLGRPSIGHASSAGKVMLAFGNIPLPRGKLASYAPRTITDPAALAEEIASLLGDPPGLLLGDRADALSLSSHDRHKLYTRRVLRPLSERRAGQGRLRQPGPTPPRTARGESP